MEHSNFTITFVRHGETIGNVNNLVQSYTDTPLNESGIEQANCLGKCLKEEVFTYAYSSDMKRTLKTAECILSHSKGPAPTLTLDERLRERILGVELEGQDATAWIQESILWGVQARQSPLRYNPPSAEPYEEVVNRAAEFFHEICNRHGTSENHVLVVSHGLLIMTLIHYLQNETTKYTVEFSTDNVKTM